MIRQQFILILLFVSILFLGIGCTNTHTEFTGTYRAALDGPGGEVAFPLVIDDAGDSLAAFVINGADTTRFTSISVQGDSIRLSFDYFDSHIRAVREGDGSLAGSWNRRAENGKRKRMDFSAQKGISYRYPATLPTADRFEGNWQITFTQDDGSTSPGYGMFVTEDNGTIHGTIRTETGDYRFLEGVYTDSTMTMSTFDGSHAYLTKATWQSDSTLTGDIWYYNTSHETWTATKGEENLRDPLQISAEDAVGKSVQFAFPDLEGNTVSADDPQFQNRPMLVYLFGSWCPNCSDEARMVRELYEEQYKETDLAVVGLAYEYTGDYEKDVVMVKRYKERFDIPWTLLVAGTSDKESAAETLPFLNDVISFPTSIFVNRNHKIEAIHVGFNGPATGSAYYKEKQSFINYLNEITQR